MMKHEEPVLSANEAACVTEVPLKQVHRIIDGGRGPGQRDSRGLPHADRSTIGGRCNLCRSLPPTRSSTPASQVARGRAAFLDRA